MRIILADDHRLVTDALKALIEKNEGWNVVGMAHDGAEALKLTSELQPDILLLDINMPVINGIDVARKLKDQQIKTQIIMVSMHAERHFITESLKAGARGYILKEDASLELFRAISVVMSGKRFLGPSITDLMIEGYLEKTEHVPSAYTTLTLREREVLQLIAEGMTTKDIAAQISLSVKTVETYRQQLMIKTNCSSVADLTRYAIREKIILP